MRLIGAAQSGLKGSAMFEGIPKSDIDIVDTGGIVRHRTKAVLDAKVALISDTSLVIDVGDEIRRTLPNGREEAFEVLDPVFYKAFHGIPDHYQVRSEGKGLFLKGSKVITVSMSRDQMLG